MLDFASGLLHWNGHTRLLVVSGDAWSRGGSGTLTAPRFSYEHGTTSTGTSQERMTRSVTLPSNKRLTPPYP